MALTLQQLDRLLNSPAVRERCRSALTLAAVVKTAEAVPQNPSQHDIDKYSQRRILATRIKLPGGADSYVGKMASALIAAVADSPYVELLGIDDADLTEQQKTQVDTTLRAAYIAIYDLFLET